MAKFIKSIGKVRYNGIGADLYENKDGTATIRFDKNMSALPRKSFLKFGSLNNAEEFIENSKGSNGLNTLINILNKAGIE